MRASLLSICVVLAVVSSSCGDKWGKSSFPEPLRYDQINIDGELKFRLTQNMQRLSSCPGEVDGKTILGLVSDAYALRQASPQLLDMISRVPSHLNSLGYIGSESGEMMDEQQLSENGWMLRGLCAYYDMSSDAKALDWIKSISENLFVKGKGLYDSGMDGLIEAYRLVGTPEMKEVIEKMLARFLDKDLVAIQAPTHASLTACRGLVRFAEITGDKRWIDEARQRWETYKQYGMTENYACYNRFGMYDSCSDPCASVDSYILALKLWQHTGETGYLRDAQLIYYNALCHEQRENGGFGSDSCPGLASGPDLFVETDEVPCCTMKGAEGLATSESYTCLRDGNTFYITCFRQAKITVDGFGMEMVTDYPLEGFMNFIVTENNLGKDVRLKFYIPDWIKPGTLRIGGKEYQPKIDPDGFLVLDHPLRVGDRVVLEYFYEPREEGTINQMNTKPGQVRYFSGPFMIDEQAEPVYHLMDPMVNKESGYSRKVLFRG